MRKINVIVSGITQSDDWYGDDVNVYVSLPDRNADVIWRFADHMKASHVRTYGGNGRRVAKYTNVNREDALDIVHFANNI